MFLIFKQKDYKKKRKNQLEDVVKFYTQFLELKMIRKHMVYSPE